MPPDTVAARDACSLSIGTGKTGASDACGTLSLRVCEYDLRTREMRIRLLLKEAGDEEQEKIWSSEKGSMVDA